MFSAGGLRPTRRADSRDGGKIAFPARSKPKEVVHRFSKETKIMFKPINCLFSLSRRRQRIVMFSAVGFMLLGAIAYASIPGEDGRIHGCFKKSGGTLRVIDRSVTNCSRDETLISWNQQGPEGPRGEQGPIGPQ